jgi:hypothetical protein
MGARETQLRASVWAWKKTMGVLPLLAALVVSRQVVEQLVQHEQAQDLGLLPPGVLRGEA